MDSGDLSGRLVAFAVGVGKLVDKTPRTLFGRHISSQLVRSGASPAPNYEEARASESRRDFVHKLSVCMKELCETRVWLKIIVKSKLLPTHEVDSSLDECEQLCRIIGKSIFTAKGKKS